MLGRQDAAGKRLFERATAKSTGTAMFPYRYSENIKLGRWVIGKDHYSAPSWKEITMTTSLESGIEKPGF
jgi:hypothetical protein